MPETLVIDPEQLAAPGARRESVALQDLNQKEFVIGIHGQSVYDPEDIGLPPHSGYSVMGEIQIGKDEGVGTIAIIRQQAKPKDNIMLASLSRDPSDPHAPLAVDGRVFELRDGQGVSFGREPLAGSNTPEGDDFVFNLGLHDDTQISRNHVRVSYEDDKIMITDVSTNGTKLRALGYKQEVDSHVRHHTARAEDQARLQGYLLETMQGSRFDGRITVGRDTTIDGGDAYVDIRSWVAGGEAIVIDSKKYPQEFQKLLGTYNEKHSELVRKGIGGEVAKLQGIFEAVSATMKYDLDFVNNMSDSIKHLQKRKVGLDYYLEEGKGVCRHMALAVAWLGGELARHGVIEGTTTAEVNQRTKDNAAHEWARYTAKDGTVYILDPAQKYFGTLSDSLKKARSWEYFRPGERLRYEMLEEQKSAHEGKLGVSGISRLMQKMRKRK